MGDLFSKEKQAWLDECRAAARRLLTTREEITVEDVLEICPRPTYIHRNTTGQIFNHKDFQFARFTKSRRHISKGRWIMRWKLDDSLFLTLRQIGRSKHVGMAR